MVVIKIKLNQILLIVYLIVLSILLKKVLLIPFGLFIVLFVLDGYINKDLKNLLYLIVGLTHFLTILSIFIFYLPFAICGLLFENSHFTKKYIFGFSLSIFSASIIYIISILTDVAISRQFLVFIYYAPIAIVVYKIFRRHDGVKTLLSVYKIELKEFMVIIISLLFLFYVTSNIINNRNMYMSNGTYVYTKFHSVLESLIAYNEVPQYDQRIGQGEQLFLTDTPTFYSNLAFISIVLNWIPPVLYFNSITVFIIWLSILGAYLLIYELLNNKKEGYILHFLAIIGALSIVLSFVFLQLFESFKQSSTYPFDFLALSMIFHSVNSPLYLISIISVLMSSFLIHPTKTTGVILIAIFSFFLNLILNNPKEQISRAFTYLKKNKIKISLIFAIFPLILVFYLFPGYYYGNYAREAHFPKLKELRPATYITDFFLDKGTAPLSLNYPDLNRIDDKKLGFFLSVFGVIAFFLVYFNFRKEYFRKTAVFSMAYILHFLVSSIIVQIPPFGAAEYGYRTPVPFLLVVFVASIAVVIWNINNKIIRILLTLVFLGAFVHASFFVKQNLENIHREEIIAGETFSREVNFLKQLPIDGRIITFGMYSNAVDTAMSDLTEHYFSRYGYLQWDFEDNIYDRIVTMNSYGVVSVIEPLSSNELSNYLRLGGYKYTFLNICHPVGALVLKKLYPDNAYPLYQNPEGQCLVFLGVNKSNYAEKVDIVKYVNESKYKNSNGYWHITFNRNKKIHNFNLNPYLDYLVDEPREPLPLNFARNKPTEIQIFGDFKKNEWVVFKEEYFPRWKSYMDGKEIPLLATNNRMMLIKTNEGDKITLIYSLSGNEKRAILLSLPALIALISIFIIAI